MFAAKGVTTEITPQQYAQASTHTHTHTHADTHRETHTHTDAGMQTQAHTHHNGRWNDGYDECMVL